MICERYQFKGNVDDARKMAIECANRIISERTEVTSQDLYDCGMLKEAFEQGYLQILSTKYKTFVDVINDFLRLKMDYGGANNVLVIRLCRTRKIASKDDSFAKYNPR